MHLPQDIFGVIRGLQAVAKAGIQLQEAALRSTFQNSSIKVLGEEIVSNIKKSKSNPWETNTIINTVVDTTDRLTTVVDGVVKFAIISGTKSPTKVNTSETFEKPKNIKITTSRPDNPEHKIKLTPSDKELLKKLDMEHRERLKASAAASQAGKEVQTKIENKEKVTEPTTDNKQVKIQENISKTQIKAKPNPKSKQMLSSSAKERTVPSSRLARMVSFGSLAAGLGVGTAAEYMRRTIGLGESTSSPSSPFLNKANMERIVDTLCKVRGAALKIGQMLSIQDESVVNPELSKALERVRKSADFMPDWQVDEVLNTQIGSEWRTQFEQFEKRPFAAASIGQVHWGKTIKGKNVAIKIQYPGVAKGIESDIDNLVGIMKVWDIFPKGMFIDNIVTVAKRELAWEVDYKREAQCTKKFKDLLKPYSDYYVPEVIEDLSSSQVFTTEYVEGIPVDQCANLDIEHRKFIANRIMELCLLELLEFQYMQTDPNWANFLYNPKTKKLILLDFGASREYPKPFVDKYIKIMKAASDNDRATVLRVSKELGFLTGYESKVMEEAHVDAVMILGEVFQEAGEFSFKGRDTVSRIQNLVPTMLSHRLCPPPDEIYSLHRKLSGVYLLCGKLNAPIACRSNFMTMYQKYKFQSA